MTPINAAVALLPEIKNHVEQLGYWVCEKEKARTIIEALEALSGDRVAVPQGHTNPTGERLSAPDLAHRFVDETYGYEPQDPMARYLRERFTEYIEIDRAMAAAPLASAHAGDELIERVALALFHDDKPFAKASNLIPTSEELEPWRSSARAAINAITAPSPEMQETGMQGVDRER